MAAISPLVLKVLSGLSVAAAGATGSYFVADRFKNSVSAFDQGLIDFLKKEKNDIIFELKTGSNETSATTELSESFLNWSSGEGEKLAVVKVTVSTTDKSKFKVNSSGTPSEAQDNDINEILKSIDAKNYSEKSFIWTCLIKFSTSEKSKNLADGFKELVYKSNDSGGLLGILKKDNSSDHKDDIKQKKIKFIRNCGRQRGLDKNRKLNKDRLTNNSQEIKSEINFNFVSSKESLEPENEKLFNYWFNKQ